MRNAHYQPLIFILLPVWVIPTRAASKQPPLIAFSQVLSQCLPWSGLALLFATTVPALPTSAQAQVEQVLRNCLDLENFNAQSGGAPGTQMCACRNV